ncbi:DedA family protein [Solwaraspora sp. WMMD1047]|uniref:DedA family protein n=1 Tax=Solwaraspora sp. WMMD1047 TaxID=3016102 RepID=UPI0024166D29|nr:DedA family protein [Solwaraspora sp. WMMD1047]MDG4834505.1 DedA family protein [Solwaraspora sp. WMMD1047]
MEVVLDLLHSAMASAWIYPAIFAIAVIDGFFPAVPSETAVITAGVFAATGQPDLGWVIAVAAAGALVGDHVSYLIGRFSGTRLLSRAPEGSRRAAAFRWAGREVARRGGLMLVVARYIPGGRTTVTLTMGAVGFPWRTFLLFDVLAAVSWGCYSALVGYFGGVAFENDPLRGLLLGIGIAMGVTLVVELVRYLRQRALTRVG